MQLEQATGATISQLWDDVESRIQQAKSLEEAAQVLVTSIHKRFSESTVLARIYVTVPFGDLPLENRQFVEGLAKSAGGTAAKNTTPVLSLVGTHGNDPAWTDRHNSKGHKGIPLISSDFVGEIPMIARLLRELGVPLDWIDSHDAKRIVTTVGGKVGLFFVENAAQAKDDRGRNVIPAQDFVSAHGVQSVFGTGGVYPNGQILVIVLFCKDKVARATAEQFLPLADLFRGNTAALTEPAKVFRTV